MILDKIENLALYAGVNPYINKVIEFINSHDLLAMPAGKVEIDGDNCFACFNLTHGKAEADALLESHDRMIDIQLVLDAEEQIGWTPRSELPEAPYNEQDDISFYPESAKKDLLPLRPGEFLLFLPSDGHAPCITKAETYKKVIFKLKA